MPPRSGSVTLTQPPASGDRWAAVPLANRAGDLPPASAIPGAERCSPPVGWRCPGSRRCADVPNPDADGAVEVSPSAWIGGLCLVGRTRRGHKSYSLLPALAHDPVPSEECSAPPELPREMVRSRCAGGTHPHQGAGAAFGPSGPPGSHASAKVFHSSASLFRSSTTAAVPWTATHESRAERSVIFAGPARGPGCVLRRAG